MSDPTRIATGAPATTRPGASTLPQAPGAAPRPTAAPIIVVRDLVKTYFIGDLMTPALRGVSFDVAQGEFLAIMGPSGSGKSTLMNVLGLLDTPTSGRYLIEGADVSELDDSEQAEARSRLIGFVFQSFNLLPRATVFRNVMLPLIYSSTPVRDREERVAKALADAGVEDKLWHKHSNQISGGQMQRVAIARALVNDPALILADEPTGNLDTRTGEHVLATFDRLSREEGRTIVMITHEADVAAHADRTLHIRDGLLSEGDYAGEPIAERAVREREAAPRPTQAPAGTASTSGDEGAMGGDAR